MPRRPSRPDGNTALLAIPAFLALYFHATLAWHVHHAVGTFYVAVSILTFATYALDKAASSAARWRTPERTLHVLALVGGWPGALLARRVLRHKSSKAGFGRGLWASVVANVVVFEGLAYAMGRRLG